MIEQSLKLSPEKMDKVCLSKTDWGWSNYKRNLQRSLKQIKRFSKGEKEKLSSMEMKFNCCIMIASLSLKAQKIARTKTNHAIWSSWILKGLNLFVLLLSLVISIEMWDKTWTIVTLLSSETWRLGSICMFQSVKSRSQILCPRNNLKSLVKITNQLFLRKMTVECCQMSLLFFAKSTWARPEINLLLDCSEVGKMRKIKA